jgi:hypothetical protein
MEIKVLEKYKPNISFCHFFGQRTNMSCCPTNVTPVANNYESQKGHEVDGMHVSGHATSTKGNSIVNI